MKVKKYYVYAYLREDNTPYYIGKGSNKRAWVKKRVIPKPTANDQIVILNDNLTEQEALDLEVKLIKQYGRKDIGTGILRNKTDGGDGVSGRIANFTDEWKEKLRKPKKMSKAGSKALSEAVKKRGPWNKGLTGIYSEETRKKMSKSAKSRKVSDETRKKMSESRKKYIESLRTQG